jgi:hypothetical protein
MAFAISGAIVGAAVVGAVTSNYAAKKAQKAQNKAQERANDQAKRDAEAQRKRDIEARKEANRARVFAETEGEGLGDIGEVNLSVDDEIDEDEIERKKKKGYSNLFI